MNEPTLFALEEAAEEWVPVYRDEPPFPRTRTGYECSRAEWTAWYDAAHVCRDCGGLMKNLRRVHGCGGVRDGGAFSVCDDCAALDGCDTRTGMQGPDWHCSRWGVSHHESEHDGLVQEREKRRATYRRRAAA